MTKLIVLSLTATAAVSARGPQGVQLIGFCPLAVIELGANDNRPVARRPAMLRSVS